MIFKIFKALVGLWKMISLPILGNRCRYYPSCSDYTLEAFRTHGFFYGLILGFRRIGSCHSLSNKDPIDPVPPKSDCSPRL